jgi:TIR domain
MSVQRVFRAFFSYARQDAVADPRLIDFLTVELERRVDVRLVNDHFEIWRDKEHIRTGDKWNAKIDTALQQCDIFIILLTPRWLGSEFCRREYTSFEKIEESRIIADATIGYVVPILARAIEKQKHNFTPDQNAIYVRINSRQHRAAPVTEILKMNKATRTHFIDKIADDIEGMIERWRSLAPKLTAGPRSYSPRNKAPEFDGQPHNYEEVDFIKSFEVVIDPPGVEKRAVLAQLDLVERLYIQGKLGRIEFGIRRAFISIRNNGRGTVNRSDEFNAESSHRNVYYVTLYELPTSVTVCVDPTIGKSTLAELTLPPAPNENYLSKVATATAEVDAEDLIAEVIVSLSPEGLFLPEEKSRMPSVRMQTKIKAIMGVVATKLPGTNDVMKAGQFRRRLRVRERS